MLGTTLVLGTLLSLAACEEEQAGPITREDYVEIYVRILTAAEGARDSTAASDSANRILQEHGITEDDLLEFAEGLSRDPQALADIWGEIEARLREPVEEDTTEASAMERSPERIRN